MRAPTHIQKLKWTPPAIRAWVQAQPKDHGFTARKIELLRADYHVRQRDPELFVKSSFRTIPLGDSKRIGIQAVVGHLKSDEREIHRRGREPVFKIRAPRRGR